ncbi:MAG: LLM class flavin-dependent oxidoreductase [Euryarchaeota archaeon]|nr:LLM class flavin-dependent oxidoreductase [Euryarchaeota archaeon]
MDFGLNINGNMDLEGLREAAQAAEEAGFSHIWVGESTAYLHPFPIMTACLEYTEDIRVGTGIISPKRTRRFHIQKAAATLKEVYGPRVMVGLAPGDRYGLLADCIESAGVLAMLEETVRGLKEDDPELPVFLGASGPRLVALAGDAADGVLLNYVRPEYVRWALGFLKRDTYTAVYGPALLLPGGRLEGQLLGAAAVVAAGSNPAFQEEMGLSDFASRMQELVRQKRWAELAAYEKGLLEGFTISGGVDEISGRIEEYREMGIDQVVFGVPFCRDVRGIRRMGEVISQYR